MVVNSRLMEHMYNILRPEGEVLLVFLASNPIFTMYKRMAERTEWAEYMKVTDSISLNLGRFESTFKIILQFLFRTSTSTYRIIKTPLGRLRCLHQLAVLSVSKWLNVPLRNGVLRFKTWTQLKVSFLTADGVTQHFWSNFLNPLQNITNLTFVVLKMPWLLSIRFFGVFQQGFGRLTFWRVSWSCKS